MKENKNIIINKLSPDDLFLLLDNIPIAVFAKNAKDQFRFIFWNKYSENLFGIKRDEILGKTDFDFFDEKIAFFYRKTDEYVFLQKDIVDIPLEEIETKSGLRYAHTKKIPIFDEQGLPSILIGVLDDITQEIENKKRQVALIHDLEDTNKELKKHIKISSERAEQLEKTKDELENALQEKDVFLRIIAHDLRNPISGLVPFLEILYNQSDTLTPNDVKQISTVLLESTQNFRLLLENLLEWATMKSSSTDLFLMHLDINDEIRKTINLMKLNLLSKEQTIITEFDAKNLVSCEKNMLQVIIRNLLSNSIKFSPTKSTIRITTKDVDSEVETTFFNPGEPISQDIIQKVFANQIVRSKPGTSGERGSGLGLLLIKEYITRNKGKIHIEGIPNIGTKISFRLPVVIL